MWWIKYIMNRPHMYHAVRIGVLPIAFSTTLYMMVMDDKYKRRSKLCG